MDTSNQRPTLSNRCPTCGAELDPGIALGLCPRCALARVGTENEETQPQSTCIPFEPPPVQKIAAAFPDLEIIQLIGRGGMGAVYKARQPHLDRMIALKILPETLASIPEFAERFTREARLLAKLNHPNIVTVHDFGQAGGYFYLLLEFIDGVNLREAMSQGRFAPEQALQVVPKICEALQFAHEEGVLHRDIKPENILLDTKGRVKIADFGIAKLLGDSADAGRKLTGSRVPGTPQYMAPEQIEHPDQVDHRADIYSLGVVFYEMLTGELPMGRFAPPSQKTAVDSQIDEIVFRALEKERERRQQSAGEVKTEIEIAAAAPQRTPSRKVVPPFNGHGTPHRLRHRQSLAWPAAFSLILVISGLVLGALLSWVSVTANRARIAQILAQIKQRELQADVTIDEAEEKLRSMRAELRRLKPGTTGHHALEAQIEANRAEQVRFQKNLGKWHRSTIRETYKMLMPGRLFALAILILLVVSGVWVGWYTLRRRRLIGDRSGGTAFAAGLAALVIPLVLIDCGILALFQDRNIAMITVLVVDAILIWLVVAWQRSSPGDGTELRYAASTETSSSPRSGNPWPRRIFWLIAMILVMPAILTVISILIAILAYRDLEVPPPPILNAPVPQLRGAGANDSQRSQGEEGASGSVLPVPANALDPGSPQRTRLSVILPPGHLFRFVIEVTDPQRKRHGIQEASGWIASPPGGKVEARHQFAFEIIDSAIRILHGEGHEARVCGSVPLTAFDNVAWTATASGLAHRFTAGEWGMGISRVFPLFVGTGPEREDEYRLVCSTALHPLKPDADPLLLPDTLRCNDAWQSLTDSP